MIQKGGIAHHVYVFILCAPLFHVLFDMLESSGKTGFHDFMLFDIPVIRDVIVHLSRIPKIFRKEIDGVFVIGFRAVNAYLPTSYVFSIENFLARSTIEDLPIFLRIFFVYAELIARVAFQ